MKCNYCNNTNFEYLTSETNSTYSYCGNCNRNFDIAHKNIIIDSMLKKLVETLCSSKLNQLKVEVKKENETIALILNDVKIFTTEFMYNLIKTDVYFLENIIFELVQDYCDLDTTKVDIVVCN